MKRRKRNLIRPFEHEQETTFRLSMLWKGIYQAVFFLFFSIWLKGLQQWFSSFSGFGLGESWPLVFLFLLAWERRHLSSYYSFVSSSRESCSLLLVIVLFSTLVCGSTVDLVFFQQAVFFDFAYFVAESFSSLYFFLQIFVISLAFVFLVLLGSLYLVVFVIGSLFLVGYFFFTLTLEVCVLEHFSFCSYYQ